MKLENVIAVNKNKTIYRDGNVKIKVFDESCSKSDVLSEALNQSIVEETGLLNVPKVLSVERIDGKWAILSEYIEGKTLAELMDENPDKLDEYLTLMAKLQIEIQSKPCKILNRLSDKLTAKIMASELDAITRFDLHRKILNMQPHKKICHGDFTPGNIAIDETGKVYIIDWSHTSQGNVSADVVKTCLLMRLSGKEDMAKKYFDIYCNECDADRDYVRSYFPIVAAALSVDVCEEDKEKLLKWVKTSDF